MPKFDIPRDSDLDLALNIHGMADHLRGLAIHDLFQRGILGPRDHFHDMEKVAKAFEHEILAGPFGDIYQHGQKLKEGDYEAVKERAYERFSALARLIDLHIQNAEEHYGKELVTKLQRLKDFMTNQGWL